MQALIDAADFYLRIEGFKREQVLEARLLAEWPHENGRGSYPRPFDFLPIKAAHKVLL